MRVTVRDTDTLRALRPLDLVAYLRSTEWQEEASPIRRTSVWLKEDYEVVVPLDDQVRDFGLRMGEALRTLETAEGRSQLDILRDLSEASADVVRVRAHCAGYADGSVPIGKAVDLVTHAREMMVAAACAAVRPQAYFQTRKPAQAAGYVERLRMGQTERGGFVVTILSRVAPILTLAESGRLFPEMDEPFERKVTSTLARALSATQGAAERAMATFTAEPFFEAVRDGVSANLCDALAGMGHCVGSDEEVTFSMSWARTRPFRGTAPATVSMPPGTVPVVEEAARVLRETSPREEFELRGLIVKAQREAQQEDGYVSVLAFIEGEIRRIRVPLGGETYAKAVDAHKDRKPVACSGKLVKEGRSYTLQQPHGFSVEEDEEDWPYPPAPPPEGTAPEGAPPAAVPAP